MIAHSRHEWQICTNHLDDNASFPALRSLPIMELRRVSVQRSIRAVLRAAFTIVTQRLPLDDTHDGLVIWADGLGDLVLLRNTSHPTLNFCHTPLRAVFDPVYREEAMGRRSLLGKIIYAFFALSFQLVDRWLWRRMDVGVANSQEVAQRIADGGLRSRDQIVIAHPGVNMMPAGSLETKPTAYRRFFLVAGRVVWTKNIDLALQAFLAADLGDEWRLVIAGFVDNKSEAYVTKLRSMAKGGRAIKIVRDPSDEVLDCLYRNAYMVLFPPLNEDWGIVPLEAMARGKAVIANNRGGPSESIRHQETGLLLEPSIDAWSQAIRDLAGDPKRVRLLGGNARRHAESFSWESFSAIVDDQLENMVLAKRNSK